MDFLKVQKSYKVVSTQESQMKGKLITVIALANKLGGWQYKPCRDGAMNYLRMAYRCCPSLVVKHSWVGLIMVRYYESLLTSTNVEQWTKETQTYREESTNRFVQLAQLNRAKRAFIWTRFKANLQEPREEELEQCEGGVKGMSEYLDSLPAAAKDIKLPWNSKTTSLPGITDKGIGGQKNVHARGASSTPRNGSDASRSRKPRLHEKKASERQGSARRAEGFDW